MIDLPRRVLMRALLLLTVMAIGPLAAASDVDDLTSMLHEFLAGASVGDTAAHQTFWSEELVYTSSNGTRTNKAEIVDRVRQAAADADDDSGPSTVFTAEEIEVDVYGTTAIVAFKLVGTPPGTSEDAVAYYFNTGTFLKRDGAWEVVAWQATRIPAAEE